MEGERIAGRYRVLSRLGAGGMGVVYLAHDEKLDRRVALKALSSRTLQDTRARTRLMREARAVARLDHPGVVQVFDVLETDEGGVYIVMEYVRGRSLRELLDEGPLEVTRAADIVAAVAAALGAAHDSGIVHRDVKPDNVMERSDGRVVVLDFGLVKDLARDDQSGTTPTLGELTQSGAIIGTPSYLAPEQARGRRVVPASDQFALAVLAYELITGRLPWQGQTAAQTLAMILMDDAPPPTSLRPELPKDLTPVLARALSKAPEDRFDDVRSFGSAFGIAAMPDDAPSRGARPGEGEPETVGERSAPLRDRVRHASSGKRAPADKRVRLGAVAAVVLVGVTGALLWSDGNDEGPSMGIASPLRGNDTVIACPQLEASGVAEPSGWLGAATAERVCRFVEPTLGGRPERLRLPAHLLELPPVPVDDYPPDPYVEEGSRQAQVAAAHERADAWLDGSIRIADGEYRLQLVLRDLADRPVARATGSASTLSGAIYETVERLRRSGTWPERRKLDPPVAEVLGYESPEEMQQAMLAERSGGGLSDPSLSACRALDERRDRLRGQSKLALSECARAIPDIAPPVFPEPATVEDDLAELVASVLFHASHDTESDLERYLHLVDRRLESTDSEAVRWAIRLVRVSLLQRVGRTEHARALLLNLLEEQPAATNAYATLVALSVGTPSLRNAILTGAAWEPSDPRFWSLLLSTERREAVDTRLRYRERAFVLGDETAFFGASYARALVEAGHRERARRLAARYAAGSHDHPSTARYINARVDIAELDFGRASRRLEGTLADVEQRGTIERWEDRILRLYLSLAELIGNGREVADRVLEVTILDESPRVASSMNGMTRGYQHLVIAAAWRATPERGLGALQRLRELMEERDAPTMSPPLTSYAQGTELWLRGSHDGAVEAWRPIVRSGRYELPVDAFDAAGEPELARHLESKRGLLPFFDGVEPRHVRAAKRAEARGDYVEARRLARKVVDAWSLADVPVPAVDEMRALLARHPASAEARASR